MKTGVVGFGIAAQVMHIPFLITNPKFELRSVLQRHADSAKDKYPWIRLVRSIDEMLADPELELVVVTTPNDTHFEYAARALQAGKNVVLEKPFTITGEDAKALIGIARASGKLLSVYQNRRYVSDYLTIRQLLAEKKLGEVVAFEAHYDRYRPEQRPNAWREEPAPGAGILYDLGAHIIDQALCLFGLPQAITADLRQQRPHARATDYFDLWLDYGKAKITLKAGMLVREPGPRYMIHGSKGSFIKYGEDPQEALLRKGQLPGGPDWGLEPEAYFGLLHTEINGNPVREKYPSLRGDYGEYYNDVYASIREGKPLRVSPEQAYNTIRIIELATESHQQKRTVACRDLMDVPYH